MTHQNESPREIILDSIADGVFTVDTDWKITLFNRAAERITGVPRSEALGHHCWEVFHAEVCERDCLLKQSMHTEKECVNRTVHIVNKSGRALPITVSTAILRDRTGRVVGGVETFRDLSEIEELRKEVVGRYTRHDMVTRNHRLRTLLDTLPAIARSESPVLILGESGTGKELLARALHHQSNRAQGPFVPVNCGALPENLMESELFGYKKGAFTDAKTDKPGRFDRAKGGTLFLDEIGDLQLAIQAKLLRVLQEKSYEPLGGTRSVKADVRIVAATNRPVDSMVEGGGFRKDLFYRINVITLELPPLRERPEDIPLLVDHFIDHFARLYGKHIGEIDPRALSILMRHSFPGNVRELENVIHHAFVLSPGSTITSAHLPAHLSAAPASTPENERPPAAPAAGDEADEIRAALLRNRYSRKKTARDLGIHPTTLWRKMKSCGLS